MEGKDWKRMRRVGKDEGGGWGKRRRDVRMGKEEKER